MQKDTHINSCRIVIGTWRHPRALLTNTTLHMESIFKLAKKLFLFLFFDDVWLCLSLSTWSHSYPFFLIHQTKFIFIGPPKLQLYHFQLHSNMTDWTMTDSLPRLSGIYFQNTWDICILLNRRAHKYRCCAGLDLASFVSLILFISPSDRESAKNVELIREFAKKFIMCI